MEFRIGINLGYVLDDEDRIYGDGVNGAELSEADLRTSGAFNGDIHLHRLNRLSAYSCA